MTQRQIFLFWLPLFGSWLLLTLEGPLISTIVNRLPEPTLMLAASGVVLSLSVFIESPVINILSTSTAKVADYRSYVLVRRFTFHLMVALTLLHITVSYTPLFDLIGIRMMGLTPEVAENVRLGLQINLLWSAAIGWRRFLQGVLIKFGRTRPIALGTAVRLLSGATVALSLAFLTDVSGVVLAAITWSTGVTAEALYVTAVVRPLFKKELHPDTVVAESAELTYNSLFRFHLPLASTSILTLLVQPLAVFTLARMANPLNTLAAWPILFQLLLIARAPALAIPEVIIALNGKRASAEALTRFVRTLIVITLIGTLIYTFTPFEQFYLNVVQQTPHAVTPIVEQGMTLSIIFPMLAMVAFATRGFLISQQRTAPINTGMFINLAITAAILLAGPLLPFSSIVVAVIALNVAAVVELLYLRTQTGTTAL